MSEESGHDNQSERDGHCPSCGMPIHSDWAHCPDCGTALVEEVEVTVDDDALQNLDTRSDSTADRGLGAYATTGLRHIFTGAVVGIIALIGMWALTPLIRMLPDNTFGALMAGITILLFIAALVILQGKAVYHLYGWE